MSSYTVASICNERPSNPSIKPFNIFPFGLPGMGKSSLKGSCVKIFSPNKKIVDTVLDMECERAQESLTLDFSMTLLEGTSINICDVYGWRRTGVNINFNEGTFGFYLRGAVRPGRKQPERVEGMLFDPPDANRTIDCVLFFLEALNYSLNVERDRLKIMIAELTPYIQLAESHGAKCIFVINQVDKIRFPDPSDPNKVYEPWQHGVTTLYQVLNSREWRSIEGNVRSVNGSRLVLPCMTYRSQQLQTQINLSEVNKFCLHLLATAIGEADFDIDYPPERYFAEPQAPIVQYAPVKTIPSPGGIPPVSPTIELGL